MTAHHNHASEMEVAPTDTFYSNSCDGTEKKPNAAKTGELCATGSTLIKTLEDREERAKCQTSRCTREHAQSHISAVVTLAFPNNDMVHSRSRVPAWKAQQQHYVSFKFAFLHIILFHVTERHITFNMIFHFCTCYSPWY